MTQYKNLVKGFKLVDPSLMFEKMSKYAQKGALRGVDVGFPNCKENYTMSLPGVTDWTGFPFSGKTQVVLEFLLHTSIAYGWKHLIYLPDLGDDSEILGDLIHKYTSKSFDKRSKNLITELEIASAIPWVTEHFKILTKEEITAKMTPYEFWNLTAEMSLTDDIKTGTIDAWKDMKHDISSFGRDDKYLEDVLSYRNAISEKFKIHLHTIIHPIKTEKDSSGNRKPPTPYDLKGGTEWYNNGKNMVTVFRPPGEGNKVLIYWNKIKPRSIGSQGVSELYLDLNKFRYYMLNGQDKVYATDQDIELVTDKVASINGDDDDDVPF